MSSVIGKQGIDESSSTMASPRSVYRPEIEGLRAIAILLILAYHAKFASFSGGYIGVDVFFVLSGYLITGLLVREVEHSGSINLTAFYARRARRLLPALTLMLLVTVFVSFAIYPPNEVDHGGFAATAVSTAAYVSNLYFAGSGTGYFDAAREHNPFLHTWSLSVEEQFYLVWPIFVMMALCVLPWQNRTKITRRRLLWWMLAAAATSFALSVYLTNVRQPWAYFISPARAWEFALGAIVVLLPQNQPFCYLFNKPTCHIMPKSLRLRGLMGKIKGALGWIGLVGIFVSAIVLGPTTAFPGFAALLPAFSTALVLRATANPAARLMVKMLGVKPLRGIGQLSYSWYLWHWPVLVIGSALLGAISLTVRVELILLSFFLSLASYRLVENPIRNNARLASHHAYSLALAALLAIVGIGVSFVWRDLSFRASKKPEQARFLHARLDGPKPLSRRGCELDYSEVNIKECVFGAESSPISLVLFGDSHAASWFSALEPIAAKRGWRLEVMVKAACPPVDAQFFYPPIGRVFTECAEWRKNALQKIRQIRPILTVVTSSEQYSFQETEWRDGLLPVLKDLAESSQNVLILRDHPLPAFDVPACLARQEWRPAFMPSSSCQFAFPATSIVNDLHTLAARQYRNVQVLDLSTTICPGGVCTGKRGDLIIYRDSNHLTASFVSSCENIIAEQVDKAVGLASPLALITHR